MLLQRESQQFEKNEKRQDLPSVLSEFQTLGLDPFVGEKSINGVCAVF